MYENTEKIVRTDLKSLGKLRYLGLENVKKKK